MQKAFAYDNYIINDGESFDDATIITVIEEGIGLPQARPSLTGRAGKWPQATGLNRSRGRRLTMEAHFLEATAALRASKRRYLTAAFNPELEDPKRLIVADSIAPRGFLDGFGPWDLDIDGTTLEVRSILRKMTATVTGPWYFEDGPESRQRAIGILNATTNLVTNPSLETNGTNWTDTANATGVRDVEFARFGGYSYKVVTDGVGAGEGCIYTQAGLTATNTYTFSAWVKAPLAATMELEVDDTTDTTTQAFTGTGDWQRVHLTHTMAAGETVATLTVQTKTSTQEITFYVDAIQIEASIFYTLYCDGDQHGSVWSGTIHGSTSNRGNTKFDLDDYASLISEVSTLTFRFVMKAPYDANGAWPDGNQYIMAAYSGVGQVIQIEFDRADDRFRVVVGTTVLTSPLQTFSAGDWLEMLITIDTDNNSYVMFIDGVSVDTDTTAKDAPVLTEWKLGSDYDGTWTGDWIFSEFDVWDRILTATEAASIYSIGTIAGRSRWMNTVCERANPLNVSGKPTDRGMIANFTASEDVRWRSSDGDFWSYLIGGTSDTMPITVDSDDDVYPIMTLHPQTAKTGGFAYKVFQAVHWKAPQGAADYPTLIRAGWDTGALTTAKMQADGDDLRVYVDGVEVDRWLNAMDTASTEVWINVNYKPYRSYTLATDIGAGESASTITLNESLRLPRTGIIQIGSEYFVYTGTDFSQRQLTGVTRAAHDSTAAGHSDGDAVLWIQHEIYIMYGNGSLAAPTPDDDYKPIINLAISTNDSWVYAEFGDGNGKRTGRWSPEPIPVYGSTSEDPTFYTASQDAEADPYTAMGIDCVYYKGWGQWLLYNPCGIGTANFSAGSQINPGNYWGGVITSSKDGAKWTLEYDIPAPAGVGWEAWSRSQALDTGSVYVALRMGWASATNNFVTLTKLDATAATLTLNTDNTPDVVDGDEQANYQLAVTIANTTTGESILVELQMAVGELLEVDSAQKTITYHLDGSRQSQALTTVEGGRRDWLRLVPGLNQLTWSDTGTAKLEFNVHVERRYFE